MRTVRTGVTKVRKSLTRFSLLTTGRAGRVEEVAAAGEQSEDCSLDVERRSVSALDDRLTSGSAGEMMQESELCRGKSLVQTFGLFSLDFIRFNSISTTWRIESSRPSEVRVVSADTVFFGLSAVRVSRVFRQGELRVRSNLLSAICHWW